MPALVHQLPGRHGGPMHLPRGRAGGAHGVRRWVLRGVIAVLVLALAGVLGVAWYFSGVAIAVGNHQLVPGTTVVALSPDRSTVQLARGHDPEMAGVQGLEWAGGYGRLGAVLDAGPTTVIRSFTPVQGLPDVGTRAGIDADAYPGDPRTALGLAFEEVRPRSDVGYLPTWYMPAPASTAAASVRGSAVGSAAVGTWVVFVHGHDSGRREALRYLTYLHDRGLPVLVPSYRNDPGAPASADHTDHLGDTEWRDVEATVRWALGHGAHDVVLFGWSMGGAVSLQLVDRSPLRTAVRGLVLDSPVIDWRDVLAHQGADRGLPGPITDLAEIAVEQRIGIDLDRFDWEARAGQLHLPIMLVHSGQDTYVTDGPSRAVARARPDLVTDLVIPGAEHTRGWNVDPERYQSVLGPWLTRVAG